MDNRYSQAFKRMLRSLEPIAKHYGKSRSYFVWDALWAYVRYGVTPNEYIGFQFFRLSTLERKRFYTARDSNRYERKFNDSEHADKFNKKEITNKVFGGLVSREWIYTGNSTIEDISNFLARHTKVIVKPTGLSSGWGIFSLKNENGLSITELTSQLGVSNVLESNVLIEEFITQHDEMSALNPSSVNTVRVFTVYNTSDDRVTILSAAIRVGGAGSDVDNYHSGGVGYPLDTATGIVKAPGADIVGGRHVFHPSTHKLMLGFTVPRWSELLAFVETACRIVPQGRLIGWDIAVTPSGFDLIEANYEADPGFMQTPAVEGCKPIILQNL